MASPNDFQLYKKQNFRKRLIILVVLMVAMSYTVYSNRKYLTEDNNNKAKNLENKQQLCLPPHNFESLLPSQKKFKLRNKRKMWAVLISQIRDIEHNVTIMKRGAEVGVYEGEFSQAVLQEVKSLQEYILVDPWRHLDDWNKPWNKDDDEFSKIFNQAMAVTRDNKEYGDKVTVIRKTGLQAAKEDIKDNSLDFLYIDGDHTAKGCLKDILAWYPKVKCGGLLLGDDYMDADQHKGFAPTFVKSIVDGFAETIGVKVHDMGAYNWVFVKPFV